MFRVQSTGVFFFEFRRWVVLVFWYSLCRLVYFGILCVGWYILYGLVMFCFVLVCMVRGLVSRWFCTEFSVFGVMRVWDLNFI